MLSLRAVKGLFFCLKGYTMENTVKEWYDYRATAKEREELKKEYAREKLGIIICDFKEFIEHIETWKKEKIIKVLQDREKHSYYYWDSIAYDKDHEIIWAGSNLPQRIREEAVIKWYAEELQQKRRATTLK